MLRASILILSLLVPHARAQDGSIDRVPVDPDALVSPGIRESLAGLDPGAGGWDGEVLLGQLEQPLAVLGAVLRGDVDPWIAAGELAAPELVPGARVETGEPVRHGAIELVTSRGGESDRRAPGSEALAQDLVAIAALAGEGERRSKVKVVGLKTLDDGGCAARLRMEVGGPGSYIVAHADAEWSAPSEAGQRLRAFAVVDLELSRGPERAQFADVTEYVLGGDAFDQQLRPGLEYWRARLDSTLGVGFLGHQGLAVGDVNGDGLEDLYLCQPGGLPNRLFLHREDGTTLEAAAAAGVDVLQATSSALLVDLDGDGALDLVLGTTEELALFQGNGEGRFEPRVKLPAPATTSLAVADVDGDGLLDLFACAYQSPYDGKTTPVPYHDAGNGAPNLLFRNQGAFEFVESSEAAGLRAAPPRFSFAAAFEDYDRDGDQDLYVANDFGRNELWRNDGDGTFVDVAALLGVEDLSAGMGVSWADVDGDGWMDLHVANMYSAAGKRVAYGRRFRPGADPGEREGFQRHARGNSLFLNAQGRAFVDVSEEANVGMGRWAWGALFVELDNDGRPDLVVPNGFVTNERDDDL